MDDLISRQAAIADAWHLSKEERSRVRSKTFPGIAKAMAEQWGVINDPSTGA